MLSKDDQKKLLQALKVPEETIAQVLDSDEEQSITLPDVKIYTAAELESVKTNAVNAKKQEHINIGKELKIKELKEKAGLEFDGKDDETLLEQYANKVKGEANIKPKELEQQHELKRQEWAAKLKAKEDEAAAHLAKLQSYETKAEWQKDFPEGELSYDKEDIMLILEAKMKAEKKETGEVYSFDGVELKDDTDSPLSRKAAFAKIFEQKKWVAPKTTEETQAGPKGLGFEDTGAVVGTFKSFDEFNTHLEKQGINPGSTQANKMLEAAVAKNPKLLEIAG